MGNRNKKIKRSSPESIGQGVVLIIHNAGYLLGGRWLNLAVRFVYAIFLAHLLGPELYGVFNYGIAWYLAFIPLTGLGLDIILSRQIGQDRSRGDRVVSQTFALRIISGCIAALACGWIGWIMESQPEIKKLLLVFSAAMLGRSIAVWTDSVFAAYESMKYSLQLQAIFRPLEVISGLTVLLAGGGLLGLAAVQAASWWLQALCGITLLRRFNTKISVVLAKHGLKPIFFQGIPIMIGAIMMTWLSQGTLVMFRHLYGSQNSLGQLALAMQLFMVFYQVPLAINAAALPVLSRAIVRRDGKDIYYVSAALRIAMVVGAGVGLAGLGAGPWIVTTVFGAQYTMAGHLVGPVMWLLIPWSCGSAIWRVFLARGHFYSPIACAAAGAITLVSSMPLLVSGSGALGAVYATGAGMSVCAICLIVLFLKSGELNPKQVILKPVAAIVVALGIYLILSQIRIWLALPASWIALMAGSLFFGVITPDERVSVLRALN